MAARVDFLVATKYDGSGFNAAVAGATKLDAAQKKVTASSSKLADSVGKVSTTLARSVGVFGLSSTSLRALDDAADIAELGLRGMEGGLKTAATSAVAFNAATIGAAGAAGALGFAIGSWLAKFPAVAAAADQVTASLRRMVDAVGLADVLPWWLGGGGRAGAGPDFDQGAIATGFEAMIARRIADAKAMQRSVDDILKLTGTQMKQVLAPLAEADQIAKLQEWGFSIEEAKKVLPGLTDNLKPLTDAQRDATKAAEEHTKELERLAEASMKAFEDQALSASMAAEEKLLEEVEQQAKAAEEAFQDLEKAALDAAMAAEQWELDQELEESAAQAEALAEELEKAKEEAERMAEVHLDMMLEGLVNLVGLFGEAWAEAGEIIANTVKQISEAATSTEKAAAVMRGVGQIGGMIGGKFGGALTGAAGGAMTGAALGSIIPGIGTVVGGIVGGLVGGIAGLFGDSKKKAEELKRKQAEAIDAFADLYQQWVAARQELAMKGAEGVSSLIDSMFVDGEFNEQFTSAANAAEYVAAQFSAMLAAGIPLTQILDKLGPALETMGKEAKKFAGTAAAPLIQLAKVAKENEALLQFQQGLADTAVSLSALGMLTQDLATKMSIDLGNSVDTLTQKFGGGESGYMQALRLSAEALFKLQQAADKSQVKLDDHTQKMIDDAQAAGLFEGLQDPMQQLIEINNAMLATMAQLVSLMGGAVPAAIQAMIDAFNNAQFNTPGPVETGGPVNGPGPGPGPGDNDNLPNKPMHNFQHGSGGVRDFGSKGELAMLHGREAVIPEAQLGGDSYYFTVMAQPNQDPREIAEATNREFRLNRRGRYTQNLKGRR